MKAFLAACLLICLAAPAAAAEWWDEWQNENQWTDHHNFWGPVDDGPGHPQAFRTGVGSQAAPFKWVRSVAIQRGVNSTLHFETHACGYGEQPQNNNWDLKVVVDGKVILAKNLHFGDGWQSWDIDLSSSSGRTIRLELWNAMPDDHYWPWAIWDNVRFAAKGGVPPPPDQSQNQNGKKGKTAPEPKPSRPLGL
jgi:hypothetical protein